MKPETLGSLSSYLSSLDEDLATRLDDLWGRYPALAGFSVRGADVLPEPLRANVQDTALVVAEVGVDPLCGAEYSERVSDEIAVALLDFVKGRPEAAELLRDRTFARTLH
ncbi:MAG: hypothetical protein JO035_11645 [Betaproteobacteria bacterium]|nr:hypothetical protein [Betaproteobacteria bacterium]